ncbi:MULTISPECIES: tRNA lysidine(34) synthetase TilS [Vibrio]|uniref:tRNA(Ile)-lysidine synthase n=1 Tax=Vibrio algicola TaxID=2662262 RepID=A0A5Q0TE89_9VIBR|nr:MULTISPECIES: tRNA lysidine(34) synthetase TilS [Vibrio]MBD1575066.1 tRNA lysidine(34) synthetase TilS [Vibrio sp. S11_S32]
MLYPAFCQQLNDPTLSHAQPSTHFVLGLSGGVDSRVMLHLLGKFKAQYPKHQYRAVYVHHGLSDNADHWQRQCEQYCQQADIDFQVEKVTLALGAQVSIEQAAREARYQALSKHIDSNGVLLTGQHGSDQVETFLLALKRGSGPKGLSAMPAQAEFGKGRLLRPFLTLPQSCIQDYAQQHKLNWIEDESNQDTRFDRNFIRHQITPILKARWPHIESTIARSAGLCAEQEDLLQSLLSERLKSMMLPDDSISIESLKQQTKPARDALLRMWIGQQHHLMPSAKQLQQIWQDVALAKTDAAPKFRYGLTQLGRFENRLYVFVVKPDISSQVLEWNVAEELELPNGLGHLQLISGNQTGGLMAEDENIITLRLPEDIQHLQVQFSFNGITAHPESRQHSRKLKKLLQEYKIPTWQRDQIPLLMDKGELVSALGLFVCKPYSGCSHQLRWFKMENDI